MYLVLAERKVSAWMQDRIGPNRVGPFGLFQPMADGLKILLKEGIIPSHVDKGLFLIAPAISHVHDDAGVCGRAVWAGGTMRPSWLRFIIAPNVDIGLVFIFAVGSLAVYGVILGGWASNNKYSALGSLRASAQVVSYEIPLGMSVLGVVLLCGTLNLEKILEQQAAGGFWQLEHLVSAAGVPDFLRQLAGRIEPAAVRPVGVRAGARRRLPHRIRRLADGDVLRRRIHARHHDQLPDGDPVFRRLALSRGSPTPESAYAGAWVVKMLVLLAKVAVQHLLDHADSLDDSAVPLRSVDGADVEGVHSAVAGEHGGGDDRACNSDWNRWWLLPISIAAVRAGRRSFARDSPSGWKSAGRRRASLAMR